MIHCLDTGIIPFKEIITSYSRNIVSDLRRELDFPIIHNKVWDNLQFEAEIYLSSFCLPSLYCQFNGYRHFNRTGIAADNPTNNSTYNAFVEKFFNSQYSQLFNNKKYFVSSINQLSRKWKQSIRLLLIRLNKDFEALHSLLPSNTKPAHIINISSALSEMHNGQAVRRIDFDNGTFVIYKPRNLGLEKAWFQITGWLNFNSSRLSLFAPRVLMIDNNYGWVEYIEHKSVKNVQQLEEFYYNIGQLLCWLRIFGARDVVRSNLVAGGEKPFFIDAETLFYPHRFLKDAPELESFDVTKTGMLPIPQANIDGEMIFTSAVAVNTHCWENAWACTNTNTDEMEFGKFPTEIHNNTCMPILDGNLIAATDYVYSIKKGFEEAYLEAVKLTRQLLNGNSALNLFKSLPVRFSFRPTAVYARLMLHAILIKFGLADKNSLTQLINSVPLKIDFSEKEKSIVLNSEIKSLYKFDIPRFTCKGNSKIRICETNVYLKEFTSGLNYSLKCLSSLNEADLEKQSCLIQEAVREYRT